MPFDSTAGDPADFEDRLGPAGGAALGPVARDGGGGIFPQPHQLCRLKTLLSPDS